jgi:two-component system chemotaxis response regulator CheY
MARNDATSQPLGGTTQNGKATVIVVDDDDDTREVVTEILRDEGFDVLGACDGHEALEFAARLPRPIAMLLDLVMPRMGGREVLRRLRGRSELKSLPVCIVSGEHDLPPGADLAVHKPLLLHRLVRVIAWLHECANASRGMVTAT